MSSVAAVLALAARRQAPLSLPPKLSVVRTSQGNPAVGKTMMSFNPASTTSIPSMPMGVEDRIRSALRVFVGPGMPMQSKELARALGVSEQTVCSWIWGSNCPSGKHLIALIAFLPAAFANRVLAGTGCTVAKIEDARQRLAEAQATYAHAIAVAKAAGLDP